MAKLGKDFEENLLRLRNWADPFVVSGMQAAQAIVIKHAQSGHEKAPRGGGHPSKRYYDRMANLTNSTRPGKVVSRSDGIEAEILAGGAFAGGSVTYAAGIEFGTAHSKAYPFLRPALTAKRKEVLAILGMAVKRALM